MASTKSAGLNHCGGSGEAREDVGVGKRDGTSPKPTQNETQDKLAFHALAEIFPLIVGQEFDDRVADVRAHAWRQAPPDARAAS